MSSMTDFDAAAAFGDDYLYFTLPYIDDERSDHEAAEVIGLLQLSPGTRVLDAPCGHGRIANRLSAAGMDVVGVDISSDFLLAAREDAASRGAGARYQRGDLRALPVGGPFDAVVCWFNSFGYFDDEGNRAVLSEFHRVLRPQGRLLIDTLHHDGVVRHFTAAPDATVTSARDGEDLMVDAATFDPVLGRIEVNRTCVRDGTVRRSAYVLRMPTLPEWQSWLTSAGFGHIRLLGPSGGSPTLDTWQLRVLADA
jgi:SAM-dependent methyltransferase